MGDFEWITKPMLSGTLPSGATKTTSLGDAVGDWKAYLFGNGTDRLFNVNIDAGQSDTVVTFDWYYVHNTSTDKGSEETSPNSTFRGTWASGGVDATGSGRVMITAMWTKGDHQYAIGTFMWPDGVTDYIALVRP